MSISVVFWGCDMADIVVNVNIEAGDKPKVEVKRNPVTKLVPRRRPVIKQTKKFGGVLQFPAPQQSTGVLDMLGIRET